MNKIDRANKRKVTELIDLPDVSAAVQMFFQPIKINVVCKVQVDGYTQETTRCITTQGVRQAFTADQLAIKPEGQRGWKFSKLYCTPDVKLKLDDIIYIRGVKSRVMASADWAEYGYSEFDLVEDYVSDD